MAKVSVIIPVYKVEKYIRECLDSVVAQTMTDVEIVVVNDGTPDGSADIAREYATRDPRIVVIDQSNGGLSAARNTGMAAATAPFVMFVDSDDTIEPDYCQKAHDALTDEVDVAMCSVGVVYEDGLAPEPLLESWLTTHPKNAKECNTISCNKIFRLDIIREHDVRFPLGMCHEDEFFWSAYLPWCRGMAFVPDKLYIYRRRAGSIMSDMMVDRGNVRSDYLRVLAEIGDYYHAHGLMQNDEWADFFWHTFDAFMGSAQKHRSDKFRFDRLSYKLRKLFKKI